MNGNERTRANVNMIGFGGVERDVRRMQENISLEEVKKAVQKLKNRKAAGIDEVYAEMIRLSGERGLEWLWNVCQKAWMMGTVPQDWQKAVIVPLYKNKGEKSE